MSSDVHELAQQAREIISSARALVTEWAEEGIDAFDPQAAPNRPEEHAPSASPAEPERAAKTHAGTPTGTASASPQDTVAVVQPDANEGAPAVVPTFGASATLEEVRDALGDCTRCGLCEGRRNIVFGVGDSDADILFVGEGPGQSEDEQGVPFVGRAGGLLTQMIEKGMGLSRSDVYICNIVKCRPPKNRNPLPDEVAACRPFLDGQIAAVKPKVIVALGKPAAGLLLGREVAITRIRGTWHDYQGIPLMPTLHPAFVLRQYTAENRRAVWEDLKAALAKVKEASD